MDFNFKLRLIGYYNKPEQNIRPDIKEPEAASELASLLESSFKLLVENANVDDVFRSVLKGNTVFILKNEKGWLYAYCPYRNIARINGVVYNKYDITPVPLIYKGWFIPGENIPLILKWKGESNDRYKVKSVGSDFFVIDDGDAVPLDWGSESITFAELNTLLNSKYTDLVYFEQVLNAATVMAMIIRVVIWTDVRTTVSIVVGDDIYAMTDAFTIDMMKQ